jgi:hypothetical protein
VLVLHLASPLAMRTALIGAGQVLVAVACSVLLADIRLFPVRTIAFTNLRRSSVSDFPLMIVRYFVLFPLFVRLVVGAEGWIEGNPAHLVEALALAGAMHFGLRWAHDRELRQSTLETAEDADDEFPQRLGLRDA